MGKNENQNQKPNQNGPAVTAAADQVPAATTAGADTTGDHAAVDLTPPVDTPEPPAPGDKKKLVTVVLRHKTPYEVYRRVGLTIRAQAAEYQVDQYQLAVLKADSWVEVKTK